MTHWYNLFSFFLDFVGSLIFKKSRSFGSLLCFLLQVKNVSYLVDPFRKAQRLRVALSKSFNKLSAFIYLQTEAGHTADISHFINPLTPNDPYRDRTALLTSKRCILYIYSTNIGTEYFKHGIYSPLFTSSKCSLFHNSNVLGSCIIHILYTGCAEIKKIIPALKGYVNYSWRTAPLTSKVAFYIFIQQI